MKVLINWIKEFVSFDLSPQDLADRLTYSGLEVESIQEVGKVPSTVKVVQIEKIEKHPQADRLSLCTVLSGDQLLTIVCGAKNMQVGDKVPLALPGTILPDGKEIQRSKIRGVSSDGMLCSEKELGLSSESEGLFILPPELPTGHSLSDLLPTHDTLLEINVTPNRGDCLSMIGIAREVSILTGSPFSMPENRSFSETVPAGVSVQISEKGDSFCSYYSVRRVKGVRTISSPYLLKKRLEWIGIRSINLIVDLTNYILMETGQPLHAFDRNRITHDSLVVDCLSSAAAVATLDGQERKIEEGDGIVRSGEQILAIAGVIGGENSAVTSETEDILIEAACFEPVSVRKTATRLALHTESSYRFARGIDPALVSYASDRMVSLLCRYFPDLSVSSRQDVGCNSFPRRELLLRGKRVRGLLGVNWSDQEIEAILLKLSFQPRVVADSEWSCSIPTYRHDLSREVDLIEEVARIKGYDQIPSDLPSITCRPSQVEKMSVLEREIRTYFSKVGFSEVIHYSFCSEKEILQSAVSTPANEWIRLANPLSEELSILRPSLLPSLISAVRFNQYHRNLSLKLFELRSVYRLVNGKVKEEKKLGVVLTGDRYQKQWGIKNRKGDFFDLKGALEGLWENLKLPDVEAFVPEDPSFHPGVSTAWKMGEKTVGIFGAFHPELTEKLGFEETLYLGEFNLEEIVEFDSRKTEIMELSKFPGIERDLTFLTSRDLSAVEIIRVVTEKRIPSLVSIRLVDCYEGEAIEKEKKALTYAILYQLKDRTLTDEEVNVSHEKLVEDLQKHFPIQRR